MHLDVRMFGGLTERVGASRVTVELPDDATVADLREQLASDHPALTPLLPRVQVAVDLEVARDDRPLAGARECALLPPVAGGAAGAAPTAPVAATRADGRRVLTGLVAPPFDVPAALQAVSGPEVGGTVVFLGSVRDHAPDLDGVVTLEYSAYPEMAERVLATVADEVLEAHPQVRGVALLHAVGALPVGADTVLVVCAAAHRGPAFDACRDALEHVKDRVPVWKREITADGAARWVGLPEDAGAAEAGPP